MKIQWPQSRACVYAGEPRARPWKYLPQTRQTYMFWFTRLTEHNFSKSKSWQGRGGRQGEELAALR
jgi:hypothetical protein